MTCFQQHSALSSSFYAVSFIFDAASCCFFFVFYVFVCLYMFVRMEIIFFAVSYRNSEIRKFAPHAQSPMGDWASFTLQNLTAICPIAASVIDVWGPVAHQASGAWVLMPAPTLVQVDYQSWGTSAFGPQWWLWPRASCEIWPVGTLDLKNCVPLRPLGAYMAYVANTLCCVIDMALMDIYLHFQNNLWSLSLVRSDYYVVQVVNDVFETSYIVRYSYTSCPLCNKVVVLKRNVIKSRWHDHGFVLYVSTKFRQKEFLNDLSYWSSDLDNNKSHWSTTLRGCSRLVVEYRTRNREVAGSTHTRSTATNLE